MRKLVVLLLLLPLSAWPQAGKQCKKCKDPCSGCAPTSRDTIRLAMADTFCCPQQIQLDSALTAAIIKKLDAKGGNFSDGLLKWLTALFPLFLAWLAYRYAKGQSRFDNLLKTDIEWIKDFRNVASEVLADLQALMILINIVEAKEDALDDARAVHQQRPSPASHDNVQKAREEMQIALNNLVAKYTQSLKPLTELKLSLPQTPENNRLIVLIDNISTKMTEHKVLEESEINLVIDGVRDVLARQRAEIQGRA